MNDDELIRRYQAGMRQAGASAGNAPDPEIVLRVARGDATEAERLRVLDAVMQSDELRREYDTYRALAAGARSAASVWPRRLAAAALVALVAGAGYWALFWRSQGVSWRGGGGGVATISPANGAEIAAPVRLVWHPCQGRGSTRSNSWKRMDGWWRSSKRRTRRMSCLPGPGSVPGHRIAGESRPGRAMVNLPTHRCASSPCGSDPRRP